MKIIHWWLDHRWWIVAVISFSQAIVPNLWWHHALFIHLWGLECHTFNHSLVVDVSLIQETRSFKLLECGRNLGLDLSLFASFLAWICCQCWYLRWHFVPNEEFTQLSPQLLLDSLCWVVALLDQILKVDFFLGFILNILPNLLIVSIAFNRSGLLGFFQS